MKKKLLSFLLVASLLGATGCNLFKEETFDPWDNLDGGGSASAGEISKEEASDYLPPAEDQVNKEDYKEENNNSSEKEDSTEEEKESSKEEENESSKEDSSSDVQEPGEEGNDSSSDVQEPGEEEDSNDVYVEGKLLVDFSTLTEETAPTGTKFKDGTLTIKESGAYLLTGALLGNVVVKDTEGEVQLALSNATITTPTTSASAAILFEKTSSTRLLTVVKDTVNVVSDSIGDTDADGDGAAVQAKKCSLVINGQGKLILKGVGESASGLKVKKKLTIVDTQIEIEAAKNGIKADEQIYVYDANIKITAQGDGMKTDMEAGDMEEATEFAADPSLGYIYIENTSFEITAKDDGICANNCMYIANNDTNYIKILTNGGAPNTITESSSDNADGKALKVDGITLVQGEEEKDIPAGYEENYALVITGGNFEINSNDDAVSSKGNLLISGGTFNISTGDDGIHAEYLTKINGGTIFVDKAYEGIEGAAVEIMGGDITVVTMDDGINAANADLKNYDYHIYIGGGNIWVNAQGDGVDANGWVKMDGGTLIVYGPTNGGNGSLDSDKGFLMNEGDLIAVGAMGMVENPASNSQQCYISINLSENQKENTPIYVYDDKETLLYEVMPTKKYQSVIISLKAFEKGKTYVVKVGEQTYEATLNNIGTALGTNQMGGGNQGFRPGPGGFFPGGGW